MNFEVSSSYWSTHEHEILEAFKTPESGLSDTEAGLRHSSLITGSIRSKRKSSVSILVAQFNSPIILLLFISALMSFYLDDTTNAVIIMIILVLSGLLSFWQERTAADAVSQLLKIIEVKSLVLRSGRETQISVDGLVLGDIVLLRAGSIVPGDCRVLESRNLLVNESVLTGESFPIEKSSQCVASTTSLPKRTSALHMGTHVVSGTGKAVIVRLGNQTEFGNISSRLKLRPPISGFEKGLKNFGNLLLAITVLLVLVVFLVNVYLQRPVIESLLFALALAVGMTPQLLPAITSVVLANGAKAMARSQVIVKRLLAIENFGGMDILCMDKTGTLTEGTIKLHGGYDSIGQESDNVLRLAGINAKLQTGFENPIDLAIREAATSLISDVTKLDEVPYDFTRKRLSVLAKTGDTQQLITKGAFENVLQCCTKVRMSNGEKVPIDNFKDELLNRFRTWSNEGLRTLGVCYRDVEQTQIDAADEREMVFAGFLTFADPPKPHIAETIESMRTLGIQTKLITGDNSSVAIAIAKKVGLKHAQVMSGAELQSFGEEQLRQRALATDIFAEIEPYQKERIVLALKQLNHIVGFLGDGINDAPSLHSADVGISVASAVDVAKEAAQVVLLKSDLGVLVQGVYEGRRTLANTLKYVFSSISANFGYMLSLALASFLLPFLPLLPTQILLINLLADFPAMSLAADCVDPEMVARPRQWNTKTIVRFMLVFGITGTCFDLLTFLTLVQFLHASPREFRTGWFLVSIATGLIIIFSMRTQRPVYRSRPGALLMLSASIVLAIALILPCTRFGEMLELVRPSLRLVVMLVIVSSLYAIALDIGKRCFFSQANIDTTRMN